MNKLVQQHQLIIRCCYITVWIYYRIVSITNVTFKMEFIISRQSIKYFQRIHNLNLAFIFWIRRRRHQVGRIYFYLSFTWFCLNLLVKSRMRVQSLKKMAVKALYKFIFLLLSSSNNNNVESVSTSENLSTHTAEDKEPKKNLRQVLDEYLVGSAFEDVRTELLIEYNNQTPENRPDLKLFLDHILDDNFVKVGLANLLHTGEGDFCPIQLVGIVSRRCPDLQEISFVITKDDINLSRASEALWANSFVNLENLSILDLNWDAHQDCIEFFSSLGVIIYWVNARSLYYSYSYHWLGKKFKMVYYIISIYCNFSSLPARI